MITHIYMQVSLGSANSRVYKSPSPEEGSGNNRGSKFTKEFIGKHL